MPKFSAEQAYEKFVQIEKTGNVKAMVEHMIECSKEPESVEGMKRFCYDFAKSVKDAKGPEADAKRKMALEWLHETYKADIATRLEAGKRMAEYEKKIQAGEIPDTELIINQKSQVKAIAHDLIHESPIGAQYMGLNQAKLEITNALRTNNIITTEESEEIQKAGTYRILDEVAEERGDVTKEEAKEYAKRAEGFEKSAEKYGYKVKDNLKEGEYPFEDIPKEVKEIKEASDDKLAENIKTYGEEMQEYLRYEQAASSTRDEAGKLLKELDAIKKSGHVDSVEYDEMRRNLENISRIANGMIIQRGDMQIQNWDYSPNNIDNALNQLKDKSEAYETGHSKARSGFGKERLAMSTRLKEFAIREKEKLASVKPKSKEAVLKGIKSRNAKIDMLVLEQKRRGLVEKDFKIEPVKPATKVQSALRQEQGRVQNLLEIRIIDAKKSNKKVRMGSSEFNNSIEELKSLSDTYREWLNASESKDKAEQRRYMEELGKKLATAEKAIDKYLKRKERQGKLNTAAENTKERIEMMQKVKQYILSDIKKLTNDAKNELNMVSPEQARARFEAQINTSQKSHKLAARGALGAVNLLTRIADTTNGKLSPEDMSKAKMAIAGLAYNEILKKSDVHPKPMDKESYLKQVRELAASDCFKKSIPQELNVDTIKKFIEEESATNELVNQMQQEMKKSLDEQAVHQPQNQNKLEQSIEQPQMGI